MKHQRARIKTNKKLNFLKPQNYLCLVMVEAFVGAAKTLSVIHYLTLETGRKRLKMIIFKKDINTQGCFPTDPQVFVSHQ